VKFSNATPESRFLYVFSPDSEIGTADSADFTDFEEVANLFVPKTSGCRFIVTYCICYVICVIRG
jgi:hypothetical protein